DAALALCGPFEVLDHVGHVDLGAVDTRSLQRLVEQVPGRSDERAALLVLLVAGLLAHEHHFGVGRTLTEDGLGAGFPEIAGLAPGGRGALDVEISFFWDW